MWKGGEKLALDCRKEERAVAVVVGVRRRLCLISFTVRRVNNGRMEGRDGWRCRVKGERKENWKIKLRRLSDYIL